MPTQIVSNTQKRIPEENLPRQESLDYIEDQDEDQAEESIPQVEESVGKGSVPDENIPRSQSIPEENMPMAEASPDRGSVIPEENLPAADYRASEDEENKEE